MSKERRQKSSECCPNCGFKLSSKLGKTALSDQESDWVYTPQRGKDDGNDHGDIIYGLPYEDAENQWLLQLLKKNKDKIQSTQDINLGAPPTGDPNKHGLIQHLRKIAPPPTKED